MANILQRLQGVHVASVTPFSKQGVLDEAGIKSLVDYYIQSGLQGAFFPSSTGESFSMTRAQRLRTVEISAIRAAGRIPILANASDGSWAESVQYAREMKDAGADVVVCMPPTFFAYSQEELREFFYRLADESPLPVVVYNHLVRLPNKVQIPLLMALRDHGNIVGVKDTHNDAARMLRLYAMRAQEGFAILCGGDGMAGYSALLDMDMLNALSAVRPRLFLNLREAGRARDLRRVALLQEEVVKLLGLFTALRGGIESASLFGQAIKVALHRKGLCGIAAAEMGYALDETDYAAVDRVLAAVRDDL